MYIPVYLCIMFTFTPKEEPLPFMKGRLKIGYFGYFLCGYTGNYLLINILPIQTKAH